MNQPESAHRGNTLSARMRRKNQGSPENPEGEDLGSAVDPSVQLVPVDLIDVEQQVRRDFNPDYIEDLATDFALDPRYQPHQPISLWQRDNGRYLLDTGENRLRAMKFAAEHREELAVEDPNAFTTIRATIKGPEPSKLERLQSQAKENLLRDSLSDVEIGRAAQAYLVEHPEAGQKEIAEWMGFRKVESGRVKVSNALKLLRECDQDLVDQVQKGKVSTRNALKVQEARNNEANYSGAQGQGGAGSGKSKADQKLDKATRGKKTTTASVPLDTLRVAARVLARVAQEQGEEPPIDPDQELDRKTVLEAFDQDRLEALLKKIRD